MITTTIHISSQKIDCPVTIGEGETIAKDIQMHDPYLECPIVLNGAFGESELLGLDNELNMAMSG